MVVNIKFIRYSLKRAINLALGMVFSIIAFTGWSQTGRSDCKLGPLPSLEFASGNTRLTKTAMALLDAVSQQMKQNPGCKVKVTGYGASDKRTQQLSWDHVNAVIRYLVEKLGILEEKFIFSYGEEGSPTLVDLLATTEDGPETVPAPFPGRRN
jgi:OmpA-OmpF porin, OOP family